MVDAPTSPPDANPCSSRASTSSSGAARPICAKVGATAIVAVPSAISSSVRIIAFLRPARSAYMPITSPPSGRVTKPTPKLATASINCPNDECTGKNSLPIRIAKKL